MNIFDFAVFVLALIAGGIASVSGFGIGSLLTPLVATSMSLKLAVALVSVPHFVATALRFWLLRKKVNKDIFVTFGIASAFGGLFGAFFQHLSESPFLSFAFGALLIVTGLSSVTGFMRKVHCPRGLGWLAGLLSGAFGGLVGNQGGVRTSALLAYDLDKDGLVATGTAVGLVVDLARMPVYFYNCAPELCKLSPLLALATFGAAVGTLGGKAVLTRIPESTYRGILGLIIVALGCCEILRTQL